MESKVIMCKYCIDNEVDVRNKLFHGFNNFDDSATTCPFCKSADLEVLNLTATEYKALRKSIGVRENTPENAPEIILQYNQLKVDNFEEFNEKMMKIRQQYDEKPDISKQQPTFTPKCPTCGSPNIKKIGTVERVGSVSMFGLFSKKINKTYKCLNCDYSW